MLNTVKFKPCFRNIKVKKNKKKNSAIWLIFKVQKRNKDFYSFVF